MSSIKNEYNALGIMSGTSLDGLDMVICSFNLDTNHWGFEIKKSKGIAYPQELYSRLKNAYGSSAAEVAGLHSALGKFIGESARVFLKEANIAVDLIASHGHTVFHAPEKGYTFQIGNGADIAAKTGVLTVCDFRSLDVARGGQGAPLVPIGDKLIFSEFAGCLNLGGFSNVSFDDNSDKRMAFDICPVNFVLNRLTNKLDLEYDAAGELAKSGEIINALLEQLNQNQYFLQSAPKSLGQEWVEENVFPLFKSDYEIKDVLRTFCEHAAYQIGNELEKISGNNILVTGGGCYNNFLMELIAQKCGKKLIIPTEELVNMKEALIFAFLGVLRVRGESNSLASVTGATENSVNGAVYQP